MKRIMRISAALIFMCFILSALVSCKTEEHGFIIDNETPFVYDSSAKYDNYDFTSLIEECVENKSDFSVLAKRLGLNMFRHRVTGEREYYYTVCSLADGYVGYIFLESRGDGKYNIVRNLKHLEENASGDINNLDDVYGIAYPLIWDPSRIKPFVFEYDLPASILVDVLPYKHTAECYSAEKLRKKDALQYVFYGNEILRAGVEAAEELKTEEAIAVWRCVQYVSFDVIDRGTRRGWDGVYIYDLVIKADGTGYLRYRHFLEETYYYFRPDQEAVIHLDEPEIARLKVVIDSSDFWNTPTWNPEEEMGFDGETTYLYAIDENENSHLISMWESWERYGIYRVRSAIEDIVRSNITVTSGGTYIDY